MKVICILLISIIPVSAVFSENLLKNPGMEESDSEALFWSLDEYTRNGSKVRIEKGNAHSGNNCVKYPAGSKQRMYHSRVLGPISPLIIICLFPGK